MKPDGLIRKTQSWSEFISRLEVLKPKEKGDAFARLVQLHLRSKPKFQSDLKNVWLLEEVPKRVRDKLDLPGRDEGIDLIAQARNGKFWAIQAKFRSNPDADTTSARRLPAYAVRLGFSRSAILIQCWHRIRLPILGCLYTLPL